MAAESKSSGVFKVTKDQVFGGARKGAKQFQEDSFMYILSETGKVAITGIFDGHGGYNGLVASNTATSFCQTYFGKLSKACESWTVPEWKDRLVKLFTNIHDTIREKFVDSQNQQGLKGSQKRYVDEKQIVRHPNGDPIHGGSTGTVVVIIRHDDGSSTVIGANAGDSTSLLVPCGNPDKFKFCTVDHGPENPDEYKRVQDLPEDAYPTKLLFVYDKANVFRKYECPRVFLESGVRDPLFVQNPWGNGLHPTNVRYEPAVYAVTPRCISKDTTCIAMTRALGDFYAGQFGLTPVPSVTVHEMPAGSDYTLVVASDGIWDCWKYEDFGAYVDKQVATKTPVDTIVEHTLSETIQRAVTNFGAKHYDDASLVLVRVPPK